MDILNFLNYSATEEDTYAFVITDILRIRAQKTPDEIAYIFLKDGEDDSEQLTYRELYNAAVSIGASILTKGKKGDRALMFFPAGLDFVKSLYACFYAGVIAVPAYPPRKNRSLDRIKAIVKDSDSGLILTTENIFASLIKNFNDVDELKAMQWLAVDVDFPAQENEDVFELAKPEDVALLQYTSGSTGMPKGVMVTHSNITRDSEFISKSFGFSKGSVGVTWLPSFHDMGLIGQIFQQLYFGCPCVFMPPVAFLQKPIRWLRAIQKYGGTMGGAPNFAYDHLVDNTTAEERKGLDLSCMKTLYCGAEPIRKETFDRFEEIYKDYGFKTEMWYPCYGMAETTLITAGPVALQKPYYKAFSFSKLEQNILDPNPKTKTDTKYFVSVGKTWLDVVVKIINPETMGHCKKDEIGELWVSGSHVAKGYWNMPQGLDDPFKAFTKDTNEGPFLRTGDLGFYYDNELFISGRLKDMVIIMGRNYYPQDIELAIESCHAAIRPNCSAAFSVEINGVEKLAVVAELERTAIRNADINAICDTMREAVYDEFELEVYGIELLRTASIPKTSSGKIQRKASKEGFVNMELNAVGRSVLDDVPDNNNEMNEVNIVSIQSWLIAWLSVNLKIGIEKIHPGRSVVAYGLNSLKAVVLRNDFLEAFDLDFPPYLFFQKMTIEEMAIKAFDMIQEKLDD
jgi:acyl-CoA synthetase (AMP-forming)/AMP-acid ligase II/acyl carrier protein